MTDERPFSPAEISEALRAAKSRVEAERRAQFAQFGISPGCPWPCSRLFHEHSSLGPAWQAALSTEEVEQHTKNLAYKEYRGARRTLLPHPSLLNSSLESVIRSRRSASTFSPTPLSLAHLAKLLEIGAGITREESIPKRAAPSGGALYPVETYVLAFNVETLACGAYHYLAREHSLEHVRTLPGSEVARSFLPPGLALTQPAAVLALSLILPRTQLKYLERGYRFGLLEAGHVAQNFLLVATALGLCALPVGGFWDDPFNELFQFETATEVAIYAVLIGNMCSHAE
jgi:SagB-type dehydrogenase family enzyme